MSKTNRMYKIFMTAMVVVIAGLLLATGIIAIQKQMKMKVSFSATPSIFCQIDVKANGADDSTYTTIFNNNGEAIIGTGIELSGNSLLFSDTFANAYATTLGTSFVLKITNLMTENGLKVTASGTGATSNPTYVTMKESGSGEDTATMTISGNSALSTLQLSFVEYHFYSVSVASTTNNYEFSGSSDVAQNTEYTANIKAKTGYELEITVTRDDGTTTTLTAGQGNDYVWNSSTGALTIYASAVTGDITINCLNNDAISYTISYNLDGGSVEPANPTVYTVEDTFTLTNPTKTAYNFAGWTGTGLADATTTVTIAKGSTGNRSYTATWTAKTYTITYSLTKCTSSNTATSMQFDGSYSTTLTASTGYSLPSSITVSGVSSGGYSWTQSTGALTIDGSKITGNITITASAGANKYTVTLNNQSATTAGTASVQATYGSAMPSITKPAKTGYTFGGYYTSTNGGGTQYYTSAGASAKNYDKASTLTLYAKWTLTTYYVYATINGTTYNTTNKAIATYTMSSSSQTKSLTCTKANSAFTATGDAISTTKGSVSGTTLTIPANTTGDITVVPKGYFLGTYSAGNPSDLVEDHDSNTTYTTGAVWAGYKYIQFNGATTYGDYPMRWIIIGGDNANSTSTYGTGANKENDTFSSKQVLLLSEKILFSRAWDTTATYNANWALTTTDMLRTYLNSSFLTSSGLSNYSSRIPSTSLITAWHNGSTYTQTTTSCKIFLLATNTGYENELASNSKYTGQNFILEKYLGGYTHNDSSSNLKIFSVSGDSPVWWLRTGSYNPYDERGCVYYVDNYGYIDDFAVDNPYNTVRPCFVFNLA